jgi:hypothetical protein
MAPDRAKPIPLYSVKPSAHWHTIERIEGPGFESTGGGAIRHRYHNPQNGKWLRRLAAMSFRWPPATGKDGQRRP